MKLKKLLIALSLVFCIFLIYIFTSSHKISYIALGDSLAAGQNPYGQINYGYTDYIADYLQKNNLLDFYTKGFAESGYKTRDLLNDLQNNREIIVDDKRINIKSSLREAKLVTISIGANDFLSKLQLSSIDFEFTNLQDLKKIFDEIFPDIERTVTEVQKYAKGTIILIGYYNPLPKATINHTKEMDTLFAYIKDKLSNLAKKHNIIYIDIYEKFKQNPNCLPNPLDIHPNNMGYQVIGNEVIDIIEKN